MYSNKKILLFLIIPLFFVLPSKALAQVVINEVMPNPSGDDKHNEWVELYNTSDITVEIIGYKLVDAAEKSLIIDLSKTGSVAMIPPKSWIVVYRNGDNSFSLNNDGEETIKLFVSDLSTDPIDIFSYIDSSENKTWGRIPDGGQIYNQVLPPSLGLPNTAPTPEPTTTPTQTPTSTPSPTPTKTASPTKTATATPKPTAIKTSTPKPSPTSTSTSESQSSESAFVLSDISIGEDNTPTPEGKVAGASTNNFPFQALGLILAGVGFMGYGGYSFWMKKKGEKV